MTGFPRISPAGVNIDKGRTPGFPPSSPFGVPRIPIVIFPGNLASQRLLRPGRSQRSVLEVAWDDVTSARAPGRLPGNSISSPFHSLPPRPGVPFHSRAISFPFPFPLALASCRWETLAWSFVRGRGAGVVWFKRLCSFPGLREFWVIFFFFLDCQRKSSS